LTLERLFYIISSIVQPTDLGNTNMEETLLDSRQVALRLNISRSYVYFLMRVGDLPCIRIGNALRVRPRDLERYLQRRALPLFPRPPT